MEREYIFDWTSICRNQAFWIKDLEWGVLLGQPRRKALIHKGFREAEPDPEIAIFYQWQSIWEPWEA